MYFSFRYDGKCTNDTLGAKLPGYPSFYPSDLDEESKSKFDAYHLVFKIQSYSRNAHF